MSGLASSARVRDRDADRQLRELACPLVPVPVPVVKPAPRKRAAPRKPRPKGRPRAKATVLSQEQAAARKRADWRAKTALTRAHPAEYLRLYAAELARLDGETETAPVGRGRLSPGEVTHAADQAAETGPALSIRSPARGAW